MVHGLGGHSGNWEYLAEHFLKNRISSYALELKGFGHTGELKGHIDSMNIYIKDVRRLHYLIKKEHKGKKIFLFGESMGGLISFMTAIRKPDLFDGLACFSPGFASRLKFSLLDYARMTLSRLHSPRKQFTMPFDSGMCTRDVECQKIIDNDPLEHKLATPKLLHSILSGQAYSIMLKHKVKMHVLFLLSGKDTFVDTPTSVRIFKGMRVKDKKMIVYPEMRHALTVELGREKVFEDALRWVEKRI